MDPKPMAEMSAISGAIEEATPDSPFGCCSDDDCVVAAEDGDGEEESPEAPHAVTLDENGFPFPDAAADPPLSPEEEEADDPDDLQKGEGSFAADFYSSGSDWSSLLLEGRSVPIVDGKKNDSSHEMQSERKLKQTNLFQMWGLKKTHVSDDVPSLQMKKKMKVGAGIGDSKSGGLVNNFVNSKDSRTRKRGNGAAGPSSRLRPCPFYKKIPGTPFTVDAFRYGQIEGCLAYFLSHFHYDHYGGLTKKWSHGPIYCTPITARLVKMCVSVDPVFIHSLDLDIEYTIEGVKVTMLEANHCPGAALIHFRLPNGQTYLHTGDFRASKLMQAYPLLVNHRVNLLYLDTTYCNPKYKFPPKEDVLNYVVKVTKNHIKRQPKTLIVVGAYSIGKECVYLAISKALGVKIFANASRRRILQSFDFAEFSGNLCNHGQDTLLHVLPISSLKLETLKVYLKTYQNQYKGVLAFRPTGWTFSEAVGNQLDLIKPISKDNITVYGVPYSEHSSFTELRDFVQFLRPEKIIPTVNVSNAANREKMQSCFREWLRD